MSLVQNVLTELAYQPQIAFPVSTEEFGDISVMPFISTYNTSQVYLIMTLTQENLQAALLESFLPALAECFRKQSYYRADMAKNTSLLILNPCATRDKRYSEEKMCIEDDPFFFKKYVLSYTELEEQKAQESIARQQQIHGKAFCYTAFIQEYILNQNHFYEYKLNPVNEPVYAYFVELCTKLPILPLSTTGVASVKSIDLFLAEKIAEAENRGKSPISIDKIHLDQLLAQIEDWKNAEIETILSQWHILCSDDAEGCNKVL